MNPSTSGVGGESHGPVSHIIPYERSLCYQPDMEAGDTRAIWVATRSIDSLRPMYYKIRGAEAFSIVS